MYMRNVFTIMLLAAFATAEAQTVEIKSIELAGEKIIVLYDLQDPNPNNEYKLELYASRDNFVAPLTRVTGDIGSEVTPGLNKKITWNIKEEYGGYKGRISLEVRGTVYSPFVKLKDFDAGRTYKRGKSYSMSWKPGASNPINIELYKGGQRIGGEMNQPNNGGHTFFIPAQSKKGNDYRIKISDTRNSDDILYTKDFKVRAKIPLLLKALPVLAIGGAAAFLGGGSSSPDPGGTSDPEIPGVPALPGN